jgi:hypothetical protein
VLSFAGGKDNQSRLTAKFNLITGELNSLEAQLDRYKPGGDLSQTDNAFGEVATLQKQINPLQDALGIVGIRAALQIAPERVPVYSPTKMNRAMCRPV